MIQLQRFGQGDVLSREYIDNLVRAVIELQENTIEGVSGNATKSGKWITVPHEDVVQIQNNSGTDCVAFDVLGIDDSYYDPSVEEEEFSFQNGSPILVGVTPVDPDHIGKFAILLEPIVDGAVGQCVVHGVCQAWIDVKAETDLYADITDGDATMLTSGPSGSAEILWKQAGTGEVWGIIRIVGALVPQMIPCLVWQDGGTTDGDKTHACNRTYQARTIDATSETTGTQLGSGLTPLKDRWAGNYGLMNCPAATGTGRYGVGFYNSSGTFCLWDANEVLDTGACG